MNSVEVKSVTLKALDESGEGAALFALWSIPDLDGDITERGFFGNGQQEVFMLAHHQLSSGHPPIAKGVIFEEPQGAVYRFKMSLATDQGRNWHQHFLFDLKEGREPRQAWSYGFKVLPGGSTPRSDGRGRILHAIKESGAPGAFVAEVSPVSIASQPLSRLLSAKMDGAPLTPGQRADVLRIKRWLEAQLAERKTSERQEILALRMGFLQREMALMKRRIGV